MREESEIEGRAEMQNYGKTDLSRRNESTKDQNPTEIYNARRKRKVERHLNADEVGSATFLGEPQKDEYERHRAGSSKFGGGNAMGA